MFDLYSLLWERWVGRRLRAAQRKKERADAKQIADYERSRRRLQQQQE